MPEPIGRESFFVLNESRRCELSALLFTRAVTFLLCNGYRPAARLSEADTVLVNSCCVTQDKIRSALAALAAARKAGGARRVILFGCLAALPGAGAAPDGVIAVGPKDVDAIDALFPHHTSISRIPGNRVLPRLYDPGQGLSRDDYFVLIAQGCVNACSYCNIRRVKGRVRSEPLGAILSQAAAGLSAGVTTFTLVADDSASYGADIGLDLADLLDRLFALDPRLQVSLGYLFPSFLLAHREQAARLFATGRVRYVNIPLQSGAQRVLERMGRRYDVDAVLRRVEALRAIAPATRLCTHLLVNFPTESRDDFLASLRAASRFDEVIFLDYSDNPGTAAAALAPKIEARERRLRLELASDYVNRIRPGCGAVIDDFNCDVPYNVRLG